jgi:chromosome segregation ATPase
LTGKTISATEKQSSSSLQKPSTFSDSAVQVPLGTLNRKGLYVTFIFYTLLIFLFFLYISFLLYPFCFFVGFEENVRKLSSLDLTSFRHTYDLKASIVGKVVSERLLEKEGLVEKLTSESRKLKREMNKAQASSLDLEQRITELADSLKKFQDEKGLVEAALRDSQKELEKLNKTREEDLKMIENLRKEADKNTKTINELSSKNSELAKSLSMKEQAIQDLEKALYEHSKTSDKDVYEIKQNLTVLFEEYKEALKQFNTRPSPLPESEEIFDLIDQMLKEFQALPNVILGASDFAALFQWKVF